MRIELHHPIANKLQCHAADPSGLRTRRPVIDCPSARSRRACGPSFVFRAKTRSCRASKSDRIGMGMANLLLFAALNQIAADLGIPPRVTLSGTWYYLIIDWTAVILRACRDNAQRIPDSSLASATRCTRARPGRSAKLFDAGAQSHKNLRCPRPPKPYKNVSRETFLSDGGSKPYKAGDSGLFFHLVRLIDFLRQLLEGNGRR